MPEIKINEEPAANEIAPEQEAAIDAIEEQQLIVVNEPKNIGDDEQLRYPRKTGRPANRMRI